MSAEKKDKRKATQYKNRFNTENYDRLNIFVPKGRGEDIKAYAKAHDGSVNKMTNRLYMEEMEIPEAEWKPEADHAE